MVRGAGPSKRLCRGELEQVGVRVLAGVQGEAADQVTLGLVETQKAWRSEATREGLAEAVTAGRKLDRRPGPPPLTPEQDELVHHLRAPAGPSPRSPT